MNDGDKLNHLEDAVLHCSMVFHAANWKFYIAREVHNWYVARCVELGRQPITQYEVIDVDRTKTEMGGEIGRVGESSTVVDDPYEHGGGD